MHEDRHQAGDADYPKQSILELRAALQVGAPVAGVHVADADENGRTYESPPLAPESGIVMRNGDGVVDALQRDVRAQWNRDDVRGGGRGVFLIAANSWFQGDSTVNWRTCQDINCG